MDNIISDMYDKVFTDYDDVVGIKDLCKMLNISQATAYELVNSGKIKKLPCGRINKIPKISVIGFYMNCFNDNETEQF